MAIIQCPNGHYYDNEKYGECPFCDEKENDQTVALEDFQVYGEGYSDFTVDIDDSSSDKTIGLYSLSNGTEKVTGWIVCINGVVKGRDYRLFHGWNRIGRSISMDICIPDDKSISSNSHIAIVFDDRTSAFYLVNEYGALTYINGQSVRGTELLKDRDTIQIGNCTFVFIAFCREDMKW